MFNIKAKNLLVAGITTFLVVGILLLLLGFVIKELLY